MRKIEMQTPLQSKGWNAIMKLISKILEIGGHASLEK
jgi:hypothetical protein